MGGAALPTRRSQEERSASCLDFHIRTLVLLRNMTRGINHVYVLRVVYTHVCTALKQIVYWRVPETTENALVFFLMRIESALCRCVHYF